MALFARNLPVQAGEWKWSFGVIKPRRWFPGGRRVAIVAVIPQLILMRVRVAGCAVTGQP